MYTPLMHVVSVADARSQLASMIERAQQEPVMIERHGKQVAVLVSPEEFERLLDAMEELEDIAAVEASLAEEGPNIPWEQVKAELGW